MQVKVTDLSAHDNHLLQEEKQIYWRVIKRKSSKANLQHLQLTAKIISMPRGGKQTLSILQSKLEIDG